MSYNFLLLVLAGILPLYIVRFSIFGVPTNAFELAVLLVACVGACSSGIRRSWTYAAKTTPRGMQIVIGLFFLSACISTAISYEIRVSLGILKGWFIVPMVFGFLAMSAIKHSPSMKSKIVDSLVLSGVVVSIIGIAQIGSIPRIVSVYDVPNSLALFIVPIVIIALYRGVLLRNRAYLVSAAIMAIAVLATESVGAIFALIGTSIVGWFTGLFPAVFNLKMQRSRVRLLSWVAMIVILTVFVLSGRIQYLISPLTHPGVTNSATVRLQLWDVGIQLIEQHAILGIGLGQFEPAYQAQLHQLFAQRVPGLQAEYVFRDPHNWIISFWLNLGILGLVSFAYINYKAIRISIKSKNAEHRAIALAGISILIFGLVDTIYWKNDLSALWWMVIMLTL